MSREFLIASPLTVWTAPAGTSFPDVGAEPNGDWQKLGESSDYYGEDGVTLEVNQDVEEFLGQSTMPLEAFRTEEHLHFTVQVHDVRFDVVRLLFNDNEVTEETGTGSMSLYRGPYTHKVALLARGRSPYDSEGSAEFHVPRCYVAEDSEISFTKGEPAGPEITFAALKPLESEMDDFVYAAEGLATT